MVNNECRIIYIHPPGASCEKCNFKAHNPLLLDQRSNRLRYRSGCCELGHEFGICSKLWVMPVM